MDLRTLLYGGPRDGHATTLTIAEPPEAVFVYWANPSFILASPPDGDQDVLAEGYLIRHGTARGLALGAK